MALTPCVYPIMSITVGYFASQVGDSKGRVVARAGVYVFGLALTYALMGTVAALTGSLFGSIMQSKPTIAVLGLILVALALSMFGLYEIGPPKFLASKQTARSGLLGAFVMGLIFGLVAGPCTGPVIAGLIAYVATLGNPAVGFVSFLLLGIGMGIPLFILAAFSARMPVPGAWMVAVKRASGFLLLGVAAYTVAPIVPVVGPYLLPVVMIAAALWFGLFENNIRRKSVAGVVVLIVCVALLTLAISMIVNNTREAPSVTTTGAVAEEVIFEDFAPDSMEKAVAAGRPTILYFGAEWCAYCKDLHEGALKQPEVVAEAQRFERFYVDETSPNDFQKEAASSREVSGLPTIIFYDSSGKEADRTIGNVDGQEMLSRLQAVK